MAIQRRFRFPSTDQEYVQYLEELISKIQRFVLDELPNIGEATIYPPEQSLQAPAGSSQAASWGPLQFIYEAPDPDTEPEPRWEAHVRKLIDSTPKARDWHSTLLELNIDSAMNDAIINSLIHGGSPHAQAPPMPPSTRGLLDRVSWYANNIARQPRMIVSFQKFLLVCLCIVLEAEGFAETVLNQFLRISISDSQDSTLRKIRKGVLVITSLISQLTTSGWGSRASLLPLTWSKDPPYFSRLSDDLRCERLLAEALSSPEYIELNSEDTNLPINIPLIVQQILANQIDLRQISLALKMFLVDPTVSPGTVIPINALG